MLRLASIVGLVGLLALAPASRAAAPFRTTDAGILVSLPGRVLRVSAPARGVLRVESTPDGRFGERRSLVLVPGTPQPVHAEAAGRRVRIVTAGAEATIDTRSGRIDFFRPRERAPFLVAAESRHEPVEISGDRGLAVAQRFVAEAPQGLYGLGTYQDGVMDWRGHSVRLVQSNTMSAHPVLVSSRGWGLLWHNSSRTVFADDGRAFTFDSALGDAVDYLVIASSDLDGAIAGYRRLTGRVPLWPRAAYGYWQSKERYQTADELIAIVDEHRARRIPLDLIMLDWNWWPDPGQWSAMVWDRARFPDPAAMTRALHERHVRLMVSVWPAVGVDSALHRDLEAIGGNLPGRHWAPARVVDAWNVRARTLYWERARAALLDAGVDAWFMDATEPVFLSADDRYVTEEGLLANGRNALGSVARELNSYSLFATGGAWAMQRAAAPDKRVLILTRSSFAGQQRHAAALWSGDTSAGWGVFRNQITAGLHYALGGMPHWSTDTGGFGVLHRYPLGLQDPAFRELYVRWFQYSALSEILRAHGTHVPREIWRFGEPGSGEYEALVAAVRLRYRLLPYVYSLAGAVTHRDATMVRPLVMDFPGDPRSRDAAAQYLLGPALLVSPVTQALEHRTAKVEQAIPTDRLFGPDGGTPGLRARYFRGTELGVQVAERTTELLRQPWPGGLPTEVAGEPYSVRFEGQLRGAAPGRYRFVVATNGGVRLRVGTRLVVDRWSNGEDGPFEGAIDLPAGARLPLLLELRQPQAQTTGLQVEWEYPGLAAEVASPDGRFERNLPRGADWIDFWSGRTERGGGSLREPVPLGRMPLDVRAGSIVPLGPDLQWTDEKPADLIELRVYPGADGAFDLYEDAGDGYGYQRGEFTTIPLRWDERAGRLTIEARQGGYPGMLEKRTFRVVRVRPGHGVGLEPAEPERIVSYDGDRVDVALR